MFSSRSASNILKINFPDYTISKFSLDTLPCTARIVPPRTRPGLGSAETMYPQWSRLKFEISTWTVRARGSPRNRNVGFTDVTDAPSWYMYVWSVSIFFIEYPNQGTSLMDHVITFLSPTMALLTLAVEI